MIKLCGSKTNTWPVCGFCLLLCAQTTLTERTEVKAAILNSTESLILGLFTIACLVGVGMKRNLILGKIVKVGTDENFDVRS